MCNVPDVHVNCAGYPNTQQETGPGTAAVSRSANIYLRETWRQRIPQVRFAANLIVYAGQTMLVEMPAAMLQFVLVCYCSPRGPAQRSEASPPGP